MARHGDTRSPSPVGSAYSSSKRSRREDEPHDRIRRDDARNHKRRSRSRSPDVRTFENFPMPSHTEINSPQRRYRDRDSVRRRDRSPDRRNDDNYRSGRKDRSRERRRSRDREPLKDYRRRSRDRDVRDRRDTSRDRTRRRRDGSTDSRKNGRREGSRDRVASKGSTSDRKEVRCHIYPLIHETV